MRHRAVLLGLILFATACGSHRHRRGAHTSGAAIGHVRHAPPPHPKRIAVKTRRPGRGHVWVRGHHTVRRGGYAWVKGHWTRPPRAGAIWVASRYNVSVR